MSVRQTQRLLAKYREGGGAALIHRSRGRAACNRTRRILCHREQRYDGEQLTLSYDRKQFILEQTELLKGLAGQHVDVYEYTLRPTNAPLRGGA